MRGQEGKGTVALLLNERFNLPVKPFLQDNSAIALRTSSPCLICDFKGQNQTQKSPPTLRKADTKLFYAPL